MDKSKYLNCSQVKADVVKRYYMRGLKISLPVDKWESFMKWIGPAHYRHTGGSENGVVYFQKVID